MLGQLEDPIAHEALKECLCNTYDHPMVRHECAEAFASVCASCVDPTLIAGAMDILSQMAMQNKPETTDCQLSEGYLVTAEEKLLIRESCLVGLDILAYWQKWYEKTAAALQSESSDCVHT